LDNIYLNEAEDDITKQQSGNQPSKVWSVLGTLVGRRGYASSSDCVAWSFLLPSFLPSRCNNHCLIIINNNQQSAICFIIKKKSLLPLIC
jgi:hypothetical protein